ncbi:glycoside hydrolase superfamily [Ilyonectria sp. MPI-CAGE-AT-0026]|nr:glycoside hydrolase superfamily [Ilyonectria sp. MPI-CAGE-AT-0026]
MRSLLSNVVFSSTLAVSLSGLGATAAPSTGNNYTAADIPRLVDQKLSQMTFLEKLAQTRNYGGILWSDLNYDRTGFEEFNLGNGGGSISFGDRSIPAYRATEILSGLIEGLLDDKKHGRLGIPVINVADSVNGITLANGTLFPASISMGQSWNIELFSEVVNVISVENRAIGIHWVLSPELDLAREPRYGRVGEMYGEDSYHVGQYGIAYVDHMQSADKNGFVRVATCIKHWIYGSGLGGINEAPIPGGLNDFWNVYITPYLAVLQNSNPLSLMPSYSSYDHVPMHSNVELTRDVIRDTLGFDGVIISDWAGITQLHTTQLTAVDMEVAGMKAINITIDHEIGPPALSGMEALTEMSSNDDLVNKVTDAARRMLYLKYITRTFEEPTPDLSKINSTLRKKDHMNINLKMTRESMVLLKNDGILPLSKDALTKVAVIGPMGDVINPGHYAGSDYKFGSTILDGVRKISEDVTYSMGCFRTNYTNFEKMKAEAVTAAKEAKVAILTLGAASVNLDSNKYDRTDGEGYDHADLDFPGPQVDLLEAIVETGTPVVVIASGGQVFTMEYAAENAGAIIHLFLQGELGGDVVAEILSGETNPSGKLSVSIPRLSSAVPVYYNYLPMERKVPAQMDFDWQFPLINRTARYPFGFGLSYTTFSISEVNVSQDAAVDGEITVSAVLKNTGDRTGKEVVQVYFSQAYPAIERPVKNLIRFSKVELKSGASETVSFKIPVSELGYYVNGQRRVDADTYTFFVGSSSDDADLTTAAVTVK